MKEVVCIDDVYSADTLAFWALHGVQHPRKDGLYNVAEVVRHTTGDIGVRLEEIQNPLVPIMHPILGKQMLNVSFSIKRFRTLIGDSISKEEIENLIKEKV